jgi:hypothetical protein
VLRAYAKAHVEDAHWIEACLNFRQAVAEEFERLLYAGAAAMDSQKSMTESLIPLSKAARPRSSNLGSAKVESREVRGLPVEFVALRPGVLRYTAVL